MGGNISACWSILEKAENEDRKRREREARETKRRRHAAGPGIDGRRIAPPQQEVSGEENERDEKECDRLRDDADHRTSRS